MFVRSVNLKGLAVGPVDLLHTVVNKLDLQKAERRQSFPPNLLNKS